MGHEKHLVEGVILDSNNFGESGRILKILTKDFGVVSVVATGVRDLQSKMRSSMEILNLVEFEFVEGKEVNRLVGLFVKENLNPFGGQTDVINRRRVLSNVVNFVLRTVVGQTQNEKLWENFLLGLRLLNISKNNMGSFEIVWLLKILVALGYWEEGSTDAFSEENFSFLDIEENRKQVTEEISKAIKSTHL